MVIIVASLPRTGSSMIAGVLHHLGVHMGDDLIEPGEFNVKGFFEDRGLMGWHNSLMGNWEDPALTKDGKLKRAPEFRDDYFKAMDKRNHRELWGFKDARVIYCYPLVLEWAKSRGVGVKWVVIHRPLCDVVKSICPQINCQPDHAKAFLKRYERQQLKMIAKVSGPRRLFEVGLLEMLKYPDILTKHLAKFVGVEFREEAARFIEPSLVHHLSNS